MSIMLYHKIWPCKQVSNHQVTFQITNHRCLTMSEAKFIQIICWEKLLVMHSFMNGLLSDSNIVVTFILLVYVVVEVIVFEVKIQITLIPRRNWELCSWFLWVCSCFAVKWIPVIPVNWHVNLFHIKHHSKYDVSLFILHILKLLGELGTVL